MAARHSDRTSALGRRIAGRAITLLLVLGGAPAAAAGQEPDIDYTTARRSRTVTPTRAAGPITLDGILDEPILEYRRRVERLHPERPPRGTARHARHRSPRPVQR